MVEQVAEGSPARRRLTARGAATRDRIVQAAADLMYAQGVNATTLDDIRAQSGAYGCALGSMANELADQDEQARASLASCSSPGKNCWPPGSGGCRTGARCGRTPTPASWPSA